MNKLFSSILSLGLCLSLTACDTEDLEGTDTSTERSFTPEYDFEDFDCSYDSEQEKISCESPDPTGFLEYPRCTVDYEHPDKIIGHCMYKDKWYTLHCEKDGSSCHQPKW